MPPKEKATATTAALVEQLFAALGENQRKVEERASGADWSEDPAALKDSLQQWVRNAVATMDADAERGAPAQANSERGKFFGSTDLDWSMSAAMGSPGVQEIAAKILERLGKGTHFTGPDELTEFLVEEFCRVSDRVDEDIEYEELVVALTRPQPLWRFEIGLLADSPVAEAFSVRKALGGPYEYSLRAGEANQLILAGHVYAPTRQRSIDRVEEALDTFLGLARVLGFALYFRNRDPAADRRMYCRVEGDTAETPPTGSAAFAGHNARLSALYADRIGALLFIRPKTGTELLARSDAPIDAAAQPFRLLQNTLQAQSDRAREVLAACRLAINAEDAPDFGVLITLAFTCLEGLLLKKESTAAVTARLREAVAYLLGGSHADVQTHRDLVDRLYEQRSHFAHRGSVSGGRRARAEVMDLVHRILLKQVEQLLAPARYPGPRLGLP